MKIVGYMCSLSLNDDHRPGSIDWLDQCHGKWTRGAFNAILLTHLIFCHVRRTWGCYRACLFLAADSMKHLREGAIPNLT